MQDFILSEYSNVDCFMATGRNSLGKCIELLGINNEYINGNITEDFETWYKKRANSTLWHYTNIGANILYQELNKEYIRLRGRKFHIPKKTLKKYGYTHSLHRVIVYEGTYIVLEKILNIIQQDPNMSSIYSKFIHQQTINEYLTFQASCLDSYLNGERGIRSDFYSHQVREHIVNLLTEVKI